MEEQFLITAHSGCENTERDSREAVEAGLLSGAAAIEIDVRFDNNGILVCSHDPKEQAEYDKSPRISEIFSEIAKRPAMQVNCDVKQEKAIDALIKLADEYRIGPDQLILTGSVTPYYLQSHPEINRRAAVFLNIEEACVPFILEMHPEIGTNDLSELKAHPWDYVDRYWTQLEVKLPDIAKYCCKLGVVGINIPYRIATLDLVDAFQKYGLKMSVWTVDDQEAIEHVLKLNFSNITTRKVAQLLKVVKARQCTHKEK